MAWGLLPWGFASAALEREFQRSRALDHSRNDRYVALPWVACWLAILWRHWPSMTAAAIAKSFCHCLVTVSPSVLSRTLGGKAYARWRTPLVALALLSYVLHPGGGLYRDAVMAQPQPDTRGRPAALGLLVRLLVGSRTPFWLLLSFGYRLPPHTHVALHGALLALKGALRPSEPFCAVLQTPASAPAFRTIAANLPLLSLVPLERPRLAPDADVCNPLHSWLVAGLGFLLPAAVSAVADVEARQRFAARRRAELPEADRARWLGASPCAVCAPAAIAGLAWVHALTALWFWLMLPQMELPTAEQAAAEYALRAAAAASRHPAAGS